MRDNQYKMHLSESAFSYGSPFCSLPFEFFARQAELEFRDVRRNPNYLVIPNEASAKEIPKTLDETVKRSASSKEEDVYVFLADCFVV